MTECHPAPACVTAPAAETDSATVTRFRDYVSICKPRILVMVLAAVSAGYVLGTGGGWDWAIMLPTWLGIAGVTASSCALNQYLERDTDALMKRTDRRPLPARRLSSREVAWMGILSGVFGSLVLALFVNGLTALLAAATVVVYAGIYTPLKRRSSFCTVIGAVAGAMPAVLGYTASGHGLDGVAGSLFALMFVWQFPHFLAIAWIYREDYAAAGLRMVPGDPFLEKLTGALAFTYSLVLLPVSLLPTQFTAAGTAYALIAVGFGLAYAIAALRFLLNENRVSARRLLLTSLVYLPVVLGCLVFDHLRLLM